MRSTALVLALWGCTSPDPEETGETDETDTGAETDTGEDTDVEVAATASLVGTVVNEGGDPVAGARVNVCRITCRTVLTDDVGAYEFVELEPWIASFYVIPPDEDPYIPALVTLTLADEEDRTLDVTLFEGETNDMPDVAEEVEVAEGLFVTVGADVLEPAPLTELGDVVRGVAVPLELALPIEVDAPEVIAVWHLGPFEATSEEGLPFRMANLWDLPANAEYAVWEASEPLEHDWHNVGTVTVDAQGEWLEGEGEITILTTVVLTSISAE